MTSPRPSPRSAPATRPSSRTAPWQNGNVERLNRTPYTGWAHREIFLDNDARATAPAPRLDHHNTEHGHHTLNRAPTHQPRSITNLMTKYS